MKAMNPYRLLRQARPAAEEVRLGGGTFPFAEAFYMDRPTCELFQALIGLGILERDALERVPERGPLVAAA